jgi:capsular exopolysaccharide synthesis family protein
MQDLTNSDLTSSQEAQFNLREFLEKYLYHWKWFVLGLVLALISAHLILRYIVPEYQVVSTILIQDEEKGSVSTELSAFEDLGLVSNSKSKFDTEIGILNSRTLNEKVVKKLGINITYFAKGRFRDAELYGDNLSLKLNFFGRDSLLYKRDTLIAIVPTSNTKFDLYDANENKIGSYLFGENIKSDLTDFTVIPTSNSMMEIGLKINVHLTKVKNVANYYRSEILIEPVNRNSSLVNLMLKGESKQKCEDVLRVLVEQYNIESILDKSLIANNTDAFINERIEAISEELTTVDKDVETFKTSNSLTDIESESNLILNSNRDLIEETVDLETQLKLVDYIINYIKQNDNKLIPTNLGLDAAALNESTNIYNDILLERNKLLRSSNNLNPVIVNLDAQISDLKTSINQSLSNLKSSLSISLKDLNTQEEKLSTKITSVPQQERQLKVIKRQQQIFETLYLYLLQKREENSISLAIKAPNAKVIDAAYGTDIPVSPRKLYYYLAALVLGVVVPFVIIYLVFLFNNKVHTVEDIENVLDAPILGDVPSAKKKGNFIINNDDKRGPLMEALRIIRTNLHFVLLNNKKTSKTIFVSSTFKGEGKTFVSINLARILAINKKKVILIGGDIRNPKLSEYLNIEDNIGLTHYLADHTQNPESLIERVSELNFDLLQGGVIPPNPSELLMNGRFDELLKFATANYDYVIVDTAPVNQVTDTVLLSQDRADLFVYVVRANYLDKRMLKVAKKMHETKKLQNMAIVLNDTNPNGIYGYGYGYGKGYGYGAEVKKPWWKFF